MSTPFQIVSTHSINDISLPSQESAERVLRVTNAIFKLFNDVELSDYEIQAVRQLIYPQTKGK